MLVFVFLFFFPFYTSSINPLKLVKKTLGLEQKDDVVDSSADADLADVDGQLGIARNLVWVVDSGEALDLTLASLLVDASAVSLLAVFERSGDVDEVEGSALLDHGAGSLARLVVRSDGGGDDGGTGASELGCDETDTSDVLVTVLLGEAELLAQLVTDGITEKQRDGTATLLVEGDVQGTGNGVLAGVGVAGKEDGETLLVTGGVRLAENLDNLGVGEPLGNVTTSTETAAELGTGNVERLGAGRNLILGHVLVRVGEVGHLLEGNDLDAELIPVLLNKVLSVVWAVEVLTLAVLAGTGVVTTDDEVSGTVVLTDNGVPEGLARTTHAHGKSEETKNGHTVGVTGEESLVDTDTGEVINVTGLGKTNDGVDEDVGLAIAGSADGQLTVSAVHGVPGLESDNSGPAELVKVKTELSGGVAESNVVVVHQTVNGIELSSNVVVTGGVEEVLDSRVGLVVGTKDQLGLPGLVWLVNVINSDDGEVAVVSEVTESDASSRLRRNLVNGLLGDLETDGHGEEVAICKTVVLDDSLVVLLVHETCKSETC